MKPIPVDLKLTLNARSELSLRSGDSVLVTVIKRLTGNKWAVGIRGRVLPAFSEVELTPGQRLRALVGIQRGRITLRISGQAADPIQELILRQGLQPSQLVQSIVTAFLRSGLPIAPERLLQVRQLLERLKLEPRKFARLIAIILEKGIDPRSRGLERLLLILGYGEQESGGERGRGRRGPLDPEKLARQLQSDIESPESGEGSSLQVFNHLQGPDQTWVVIPFSYSFEDSGTVYGTIRLRYDVRRQRSDRLIVVVRSAQGGKWSFVLKNGSRRGEAAPAPELYVFGEPVDKRRKAELNVLLQKLQNLGVKIDDTIREDQNFDGFDLPWEELSYHNVDTVH
jgi:hypothetical protein